MPNAVYILWGILLVVAVLIIPYIVYLLNKAWRLSSNINRYLGQMLKAGEGIAQNTEKIKALKETNTVTKEILNTSGPVKNHTATIESVLQNRIKKTKKA